MEFRPLTLDESRGFKQYGQRRPAQEQDLLSQLEHGSSPEENIPGVDCTLKLGFPNIESCTPSTLQITPPESQQTSFIRSTPQQLQQVRSNNNVMLHAGVANLHSSMAAMNIPPPLMSWPPAPQQPNIIPRYGAGVPLYQTPPPLVVSPVPPALDPSRSNNIVYPINYNAPRPPLTSIDQRYAPGPVRPRGSEEANHEPRKCMACKTTSTPLWRNGPGGPKSLCNACGIRFKKEERKAMGIEPQSRQKGSTSRNAEGSSRST